MELSKKPVRRVRKRIEDYPLQPSIEAHIEQISRTLVKQIDKEIFERKYATSFAVLKLVGVGVFLASSIVMPGLPLVLKPFVKNENEFEAWKRYNFPYLKRTLQRLESQKLVKTYEDGNKQVIELTRAGKKKILKFALNEIVIKEPKIWNRKWWLVSYDIPAKLKPIRAIFRKYLLDWGFYPLHESVFLHAYPCDQEVAFLREYLVVGKYVRIFEVSRIENDKLFRDFFGVS